MASVKKAAPATKKTVWVQETNEQIQAAVALVYDNRRLTNSQRQFVKPVRTAAVKEARKERKRGDSKKKKATGRF